MTQILSNKTVVVALFYCLCFGCTSYHVRVEKHYLMQEEGVEALVSGFELESDVKCNASVSESGKVSVEMLVEEKERFGAGSLLSWITSLGMIGATGLQGNLKDVTTTVVNKGGE